MNSSKKLEDFVNVSVRIKPTLYDTTTSSCVEVISKDPAVLLALDRQQTYYFDNVFTDYFSQKDVFEESVKPLIQKVKEGYNCTVFAYGQTGTGKTYTMGTNPMVINEEEIGLIPRTLDQFFEDEDNFEMNIKVSFMEIYNEKVFDLLRRDNNLALPVKGFNVQGISQKVIFNCFEGKHYLDLGGRNRHTGETKQNVSSSRSHAIFTIYCTVRHSDTETITAKLNLVDLAGSESVKKTGNQGSTFHEGVNINKGLLCIGQVMTALSSNATFIPYRQSIITTILQDSLNKRNYVSLIACISGSVEDSTETSQTLEFAYRVKRMKNKPEVNQVITQYKKDNPVLFERISNRTGSTPLKRTNTFQTPLQNNKQKCNKLSTVSESTNNTLDSPRSLFSMSMSSITNYDPNHQNFSPIIKKYMSAMEESLMEKFQTVITNTLKKKTPVRLKEDKENTPRLNWNTVKDEVSKIVREEVLQFSAMTRATSSPVDSAKLVNTRRVLNYDSPVQNQIEMEGDNLKGDVSRGIDDAEVLFKVPEVPPNKPSNLKKTRLSLNPSRRSTRLSLSNDSKPDENSNNRRSIRLTSNFSSSPDLISNGKRKKSRRFSIRSCSQIDDGGSRRSARLQIKKENVEVKPLCNCTPARIKKRQEIKRPSDVDDNAIRNHTKKVLNILNSGDIRRISRLHGIGLKTADRISFFRKLKGGFKDISVLSEMPEWTEKKYKKFLSENFLCED